MSNLTEYFNRTGYRAKYFMGDRVEGKWNGIPFVGSIGNDHLVNEDVGPVVSVHLDLPILYKGKVYKILFLKHSNIKRMRKST